jgi:dimeric dUTPase (all-alpha-NTP-PPase superfamily)
MRHFVSEIRYYSHYIDMDIEIHHISTQTIHSQFLFDEITSYMPNSNRNYLLRAYSLTVISTMCCKNNYLLLDTDKQTLKWQLFLVTRVNNNNCYYHV